MSSRKLKRISYAVFLSVFSVFCLEAGLRLAGYNPGYRVQRDKIEIVKCPIDEGILVANKEGLTRFSELAIRNSRWLFTSTPGHIRSKVSDQPGIGGYIKLQDTIPKTPLGHFIDSLNNIAYKSVLDKSCLSYSKAPINEKGFRSIPMIRYDTSRTSILLIGDSFTFGTGAKDITNSFYDLLLTKGYACYNSGIGGSDPPQYLQVATTYVPKLRPDVVIVNFYAGNDFQYFHRELLPNVPFAYETEIGKVYSCPEGVTLPDLATIYKIYQGKIRIHPNTNIAKLCRYTAIGTLSWLVLEKIGIASGSLPDYLVNYEAEVMQNRTVVPTAQYYLESIKQICDQNGSKLIISLIPEMKNPELNPKNSHPEIFDSLATVFPTVNKSDYNPDDKHFNESGQAKYADFLDREIKKIIK